MMIRPSLQSEFDIHNEHCWLSYSVLTRIVANKFDTYQSHLNSIVVGDEAMMAPK
jgi:hypothetical protein